MGEGLAGFDEEAAVGVDGGGGNEGRVFAVAARYVRFLEFDEAARNKVSGRVLDG